MNWKNKTEFGPLFGMYWLSPLERLFHSTLMFSLGAFICSYFYKDILTTQEKISGWLIYPFVLLTYWLISPMIRLKFFERNFLLDLLYGILVLSVMQVLYIILTTIFIVFIWG